VDLDYSRGALGKFGKVGISTGGGLGGDEDSRGRDT